MIKTGLMVEGKQLTLLRNCNPYYFAAIRRKPELSGVIRIAPDNSGFHESYEIGK